MSREQLASFLQRESEWEAARRQKVARAQREEQSYCDEMQRDTVRSPPPQYERVLKSLSRYGIR